MRRIYLVLFALLFVSGAFATQYINQISGANLSIGNNNEVFIDNTNDRVGIGTTTPTGKLEVVSPAASDRWVLRVQTNSTNPSGFWTSSESYNLLLRDAAGNLDVRIRPDGDTYFAGGNVGIGTTAPSSLLHVSAGTSGDAQVRIEADTDNNAEDDLPEIFLAQDGGSAGFYLGPYNSSALGGNVFRIGSRYSGVDYNELFTIQGDDGDIGIGTNAPGEKLDVVGDTRIRGTGATIGLSTLANAWLLVGSSTSGVGIDNNEIVSRGAALNIGTADATGLLLVTNGAVRATISSAGLLSLASGTGINEFSTDGTLAGNSDNAVPTEQAVRTYVTGAVSGVSSNWTLAGTSGTPQLVSGGETATIAAGTGVTTSAAATRTVTVGLTGQALALHNLGSNGIIARTGAGTVAARTITGTANQVTVTNGDGVSGNPTLALPQNIHTAATPTFARLTLSQATGTAPLTVSSTTVVSNLNADLLDGLDSTAFSRIDGSTSLETETNLAAGWYTIATNTGNRAIARFGLRDVNSGDHQSVIFYAAHHYGTDGSNTITVLHNSHFSGSPFRYIRIKDGTTYDGAALQVYIDDPSNVVTAYLLGDNFQSNGWVLKDWIPDVSDPGDLDNYSLFTAKSQIDLDQIAQGGIATTGSIFAGGDTTQYEVWHSNNDGGSSGLDADLLDGQEGAYYMPASTDNWVNTAGDTMTGTLTMSSSYININRVGATDTGINWYSSGYDTWATYMAPPGGSMGPRGTLTAPSGSLVTSWALRNYVENSAGYGWTWESGSGANDVTPTVVAEVRASDGAFRSAGSITGTQLVSTVATGTAPLTVASTTTVANLNADLLDGQEGTYYQPAATALTTTTSWSGDLTGTGTSPTIAANAVALGTDTTGNYVAGLTASTGIAVTGSAGEGWSPTVALTGQALALHNLGTNGIIARTGAGTVAARTITGTANQVTVTNGDGVSGNPTLALPQNIHTAATPTFSRLTLSQTTGTAPLTVSSTTVVANLNADTVDGVQGSSIVQTGTAGDWNIASSTNGSTGYSAASLELRESQFGSSSAYTAPRIAFHWGNVVASQIGVESSGRIAVLDNPGTGYQDLRADQLIARQFLDGDNEAYYLDPASTSVLNVVQTNAVNGQAGSISFHANRADDTTYEWLGYYSGATRQGIMLYDGSWVGCNSATDEFCLVAENSNHLSLKAAPTKDTRISGTNVVITVG